MLAEAGAVVTAKQSLNVNSVNVDASRATEREEQVIDAMEIQDFMIQEAKAEKLAVCFGCHQPGHIRRNCPDVTKRYGRPRRLFRLCYNCGGKNHEWKDCDKEIEAVFERYSGTFEQSQLQRLQGKVWTVPSELGTRECP